MVWIHAVNEGTSTTRMNPVSDDKVRMLGHYLELQRDQRILDIGSGRCGPSLLYAREFGCRVTAVEFYEPFMEDAKRLVDEAGMTDRFEFVTCKAADFPIEPERYDAAMCLGATFAYDGLDGTLDALTPATRDEGHVVAGEPYRRANDPEAKDAHNWTLPQIVERFEQRGLAVTSLIRSSVDDWDEYNSVRVRNLLDWVRDNPDHEDVDDVRRWRVEHSYGLAIPGRGWAIVAGRKTPHQ